MDQYALENGLKGYFSTVESIHEAQHVGRL